MTNNSVPSHVPEESRKEISNYLRRVTAEWSDNSTIHSDGDKILSALTRMKKGYPAIWTGSCDGKVILLCRGKSEIWDLSLKKPIYENKDDKRVFVGIEGESEGYEGDLIFQVSSDVDIRPRYRTGKILASLRLFHSHTCPPPLATPIWSTPLIIWGVSLILRLKWLRIAFLSVFFPSFTVSNSTFFLC